MIQDMHAYGPIVQKCPARGWSAVYARVRLGHVFAVAEPLAGWAIVARLDSNKTMGGLGVEIHGLVPDSEEGVVFCGYDVNFLGYLPPGMDANAVYGEAAWRWYESKLRKDGYETTEKRSA